MWINEDYYSNEGNKVTFQYPPVCLKLWTLNERFPKVLT